MELHDRRTAGEDCVGCELVVDVLLSTLALEQHSSVREGDFVKRKVDRKSDAAAIFQSVPL